MSVSLSAAILSLPRERKRKREELLLATEKHLAKIVDSIKAGKLKSGEKIALRVGKVIGRFKVGKLFTLEIGEKKFCFRRNASRIEREAVLDGFYVIRTSVPKAKLSAPAVVRAYKDLSRVERAFRSIKTTQLEVRPVFHYSEKRVRAHIFLCMLALLRPVAYAGGATVASILRRRTRRGKPAKITGHASSAIRIREVEGLDQTDARWKAGTQLSNSASGPWYDRPKRSLLATSRWRDLRAHHGTLTSTARGL